MYERPVVIGGVVMHTVNDVVAAFTPSQDRARRCDWEHTQADARQAVLASNITSPKAAKDTMGTIVSFLCWAVSVGMEPDLKALLKPATVERFFEVPGHNWCHPKPIHPPLRVAPSRQGRQPQSRMAARAKARPPVPCAGPIHQGRA